MILPCVFPPREESTLTDIPHHPGQSADVLDDVGFAHFLMLLHKFSQTNCQIHSLFQYAVVIKPFSVCLCCLSVGTNMFRCHRYAQSPACSTPLDWPLSNLASVLQYVLLTNVCDCALIDIYYEGMLADLDVEHVFSVSYVSRALQRC
jgi:hypothetical protein